MSVAVQKVQTQKVETKAEAEPERQVSVNGYIDAVTGNRIYGWAWDAQQPAARITIRLQAKGKTVGIVTADLLREDLKSSGIGDGAHAFEATIPDGVPVKELKVLAVCPASGATVPLAMRAVSTQTDGDIQDLRHVVETLCKSHGFVLQKLQAVSAAVAEVQGKGKAKSENTDGEPASEDDRFAPLDRVRTLEEATLRLDGLVKEQGARLALIKQKPADRLPVFLAAAAAVLSAAALLIAVVQ
jgi:hypothetical protein